MRRNLGLVLIGLAVALVVGMFVSSLAASDPDGLESSVLKAACDGDQACLEQRAGEPVYDRAPDPDYASGWVAGLSGVAACFALGGGLVLLLRVGRDGGRSQVTPR